MLILCSSVVMARLDQAKLKSMPSKSLFGAADQVKFDAICNR
jgi:hypothetical protein